MADKIKIDIKQAFYDLADELEKECGDWESLPETDNDKVLKERILTTVIEYTDHKKIENKLIHKDYKCANYSEFIVDTVECFDRRIEQLNEGSVNKLRLHNSLHMCMILKVKKLIHLSLEERERALDDFFKTELTNEVMKLQRDRISKVEKKR